MRSNETKMSFEEDCDVTNESLRLLDCSPLKKHVRTDRAFNHGKRKIEEFTKKFPSAVAVALTEPELENDGCDSCLRFVKDIKEKLKICNKQEMVQLLTIVPDDWSIKKTVKFFNVTMNTRLKWHENLERNRVFWQSQKGIQEKQRKKQR